MGGRNLTIPVLPSPILGKKVEKDEEGSMVVGLKDGGEFKEDSSRGINSSQLWINPAVRRLRRFPMAIGRIALAPQPSHRPLLDGPILHEGGSSKESRLPYFGSSFSLVLDRSRPGLLSLAQKMPNWADSNWADSHIAPMF